MLVTARPEVSAYRFAYISLSIDIVDDMIRSPISNCSTEQFHHGTLFDSCCSHFKINRTNYTILYVQQGLFSGQNLFFPEQWIKLDKTPFPDKTGKNWTNLKKKLIS